MTTSNVIAIDEGLLWEAHTKHIGILYVSQPHTIIGCVPEVCMRSLSGFAIAVASQALRCNSVV